MANPVVLVILDGWGLGKPYEGNAIYLAGKPNYGSLLGDFPHTKLFASGSAVGLPERQIGGSEVGHMHIGAGRVVPQDIVRIDSAIKDKSFFRNKVFLDEITRSKKTNHALHLLGLLSDGGVHSHINHLFALLELSKKLGQENVFIHALLDGRDTRQKSAEKYIGMLEKKAKELGIGKIATIIGRYYAMDRDNRWGREHKAYDSIVNGNGLYAKSAMQGLVQAYARGETDEFVSPTIIEGTPRVEPSDSIIFFNFRSDRARELTRAFVQGKFRKFVRKKLLDIKFATLTQYDRNVKTPVAFMPVETNNTLGETLSRLGMRQLRIAETEKYAHVTYFFNAGHDGPFPKEDRILVPSPMVSTYDKKPEMSANSVAKRAAEQISKGNYSFTLVNFANPDMVGHTGKLDAAINAIECVDKCLGKIIDANNIAGSTLIVTADHGNAEKMIENGKPHTSHTLNPVPFILCKEGFALKESGSLANIAPTVAEIMGIKKPKEFIPSLIK